ncbi:MAG: PIN domain-containing protein, partial [Spirochaetales bacterium]|nr:PIN domain-containing protein [Spirochaetales bacterium]
GFKALDAIHLATAELAGCDLFLTNDYQLRQIKSLKVMTADDLKSLF